MAEAETKEKDKSISFVISIFVYSCGFDDTHQLVLRDYIFSRNSEEARHVSCANIYMLLNIINLPRGTRH
jgi:hypothetical protein